MPVKYTSMMDAITLIRRSNGVHVVPIRQYYIDHIAPIDTKYAISIPDGKSGKGVCPLHEDYMPSFGIVQSNDGRERYNCFGCNKFGNVVDLHREIQRRYHRRNMSMQEAAYDLLKIYNIDLAPFEALVRDDGKLQEDQELKTKKAIRKSEADKIINSYTIADYRRDIIRGVVEKKPPTYFNTLLYQMTSTVKESE